jgi:hypothetical protein
MREQVMSRQPLTLEEIGDAYSATGEFPIYGHSDRINALVGAGLAVQGCGVSNQ